MTLSFNKLSKAIKLSLMVSTFGISQVAWSNFSEFTEEEVERSAVENNKSVTEKTLKADDKAEEEEIERVTVTGSRISKSELEGATPLTVITSDDMLANGNITVFDALQDLSQNTGIVDGNEITSGFTPNAKVLNLRGFGPQYTLVLVNGRRLANYPAAYGSSATVVNIGSIPTAAVERVEILTTGASAIYGSDAVSGVVNVILKKDLDGTSLGATFGSSTEGGGNTARLQFSHGMDFEKGNLTIVGEYSKTDAVLGADRGHLDSNLDYPFELAGLQPIMSRGAIKVDNWEYFGYRASSSGMPTYQGATEENCADLGMEYQYRNQIENSTSAGSWGNFCGFDTAPSRTLRNESEKLSFMTSGNYEVSNEVTAFVDVMFTQVDAVSDLGFLSVQGSFEVAGTDNLLKIPSGNGQNNYIHQPDWQTITRILPSEEIGDTSNLFDEQALSISAGFKGQQDNFDWSVYYTDSRYTLNSAQRALRYQAVEEVFLGEFVGTQLGQKVWDGTGTHDVYDFIDEETANKLAGFTTATNKTESQMLSIVINGNLFSLPTGDVQYAANYEYLNEGFQYIPDDLLTQPEGEGWWGFAGYEGVGERSRHSLGGELYIPVAKQINVTAALRYDAYDAETSTDSGNFTPAISVNFEPNKNLLVRASYSGIFKAPDMQAIFTESSAFSVGVDYTSCYEGLNEADLTITPDDFANSPSLQSLCRPAQFNATKLPSQDLKNETGSSLGLGIVWTPLEGMRISWDFYDLEIKDQVNTASLSQVLYEEFVCKHEPNTDKPTFGCDKIESLITREDDNSEIAGEGATALVDVDTTPFNMASYQQTGYDGRFSYQFDFGNFIPGGFATNISYTKILSTKYDTFENDDQQPIEISEHIGNLQPDEYIVGSLTYFYDTFFTTFSARYQSPLAPKRRSIMSDAEGNHIYYDDDGQLIPYYEGDDGINYTVDGTPVGEVGQRRWSTKRLDAYVTANLVMGYTFDTETRVSFTISNLFDTKSPTDHSYGPEEWPWYNPYAYSGSAIGREMYLSIEQRF